MFKRTVLIDLLLIFVLSLTPLLWFRPGEMMVGHDNIFPLNPIEFIKGRFFTWSNQGLGQDQSLIMGTLPIHLIDALPYIFGFSLQTTQKIVYVFWFFLIGASAYCLARMIDAKSRFFALIAVVLYQFNFFILQGWWIGERAKFSAYIALPLCLSVFILLIRRKISFLRATALSSLILFIFNAGGLYGIPLFGGFFVCFSLFILFFTFLAVLKKNYSLVKNLLLTSLISMIGFFLINAYYFLPAIHEVFSQYRFQMSGVGGFSGVLGWADVISAETSYFNLFRLQGMADWYDNPHHPYSYYFLKNSLLITASFLWPFLSFCAAILVREKRKVKFVLYFSLVYLIGLFFTAGTHPPLGFLYQFFIRRIPGFTIFRSPFYKFAPAIFLANAFLGAFALDWFKEKISSRRTLQSLFCFFCLLSILIYHFPYFQGEFFKWEDKLSTRLKVPEHVFKFGRWLQEEKKDDLRILAIPQLNEGTEYDVYRWGYLSLFPLPTLLGSKEFLVNDAMLDPSEKKILHFTYESLLNNDQGLFEELASILHIGYLLVRQDFYYDLDWTKTKDPLSYRFDYPQEKDFGQWKLYRVKAEQALPQIYGLSEPNIVVASLDDFANVYSLKEIKPENSIFVERSNLNNFPLMQRYYLFPSCLTCQLEKETIDIKLPVPIFLPDSPFYFLTQFKEKLKEKPTSPKTKLDDDIGFSLKRLVELEKMLEKAKKRDEDKIKAINLYKKSLIEIEKSFLAIQEANDQLLSAEKLAIYLGAEEEKLVDIYGDSMTREVKDELEKVIWQAYLLRDKLEPYRFNQDFATHKLFSFYVPKENKFSLLLEKGIVQENIDEETKISLKIDDGPVINEYELKGDWLDFGEVILNEGTHQVLLIIPSSPNLLSEWRVSEETMPTGLKRCFVAEIENFSQQEEYAVNLSYRNTLFEDLFYFEKEEKNQTEEGFFNPGTSLALDLRFRIKEHRFLISPSQETKAVKIGFCAKDLTEETFKESIEKIEAKKLFSPTLFLKPINEDKSKVVDISFRKINPTKYSLAVENEHSPFFLVFLARLSSGWQLSPQISQKQPFVYANSWLIEKSGDEDLTIEYLPQKLFAYGLVLSFIALMTAVIILKFKD